MMMKMLVPGTLCIVKKLPSTVPFRCSGISTCNGMNSVILELSLMMMKILVPGSLCTMLYAFWKHSGISILYMV